MKIIATKGTLVGLGSDLVLNDDGSIEWTSKFDVDVDGILTAPDERGRNYGDPDYAPDTTLHLDGKPLTADIDLYIVVPPLIIRAVGPVVMGCQARVIYSKNGNESDAVVGDEGPRHKIGEGSRALALELGIPPSPIRGGDQSPLAVRFKIWPGQPATVNEKTYELQPA